MYPSTVPKVTYTNGPSAVGHQLEGRHRLRPSSSWRYRRVMGKGDGSSEEGNRLGYGLFRSQSVNPAAWVSSAGEAAVIEPHSASASEMATVAVVTSRW